MTISRDERPGGPGSYERERADLRSGPDPNGRPPEACPRAHVDPGAVGVLVEPCDVGLDQLYREVEGEDLASMGVPGQDQIDLVLVGVMNGFGLVG